MNPKILKDTAPNPRIKGALFTHFSIFDAMYPKKKKHRGWAAEDKARTDHARQPLSSASNMCAGLEEEGERRERG